MLGVGVLVAIAARLPRLHPRCDVWLAVTDAEERGYTGANDHLGARRLVRYLARCHRQHDLRYDLDLDEVGRGGRFWMRSPEPHRRYRVEGDVLRAARRTHVTVRWVRDSGTGNSDHREFELAGLPAVTLESWQGIEPCRELACDTWTRLQRPSLRHAQRLAEATVIEP